MNFNFLICSERSGSNLITKIIDSHPSICGPSPIHLVRIFAPIEAKYGNFENQANWETFITDIYTFYNLKITKWATNFTIDELKSVNPRNLASVFSYIYAREAAFYTKTDVFVKENQAYNLYPFYQLFFSNAKLIWLVRDPRDMVLSWKKDALLRGEVVRAANIWKEDQKQTLSLYKLLNRYNKILLVKYEDLISKDEETVLKICNFLGLNFAPEMLNFHHSQSAKENAKASKIWANLDKGIMKQNSNKYLGELTKQEIKYIEYICLSEMHELDYLPEYEILPKEEFVKYQYNLTLNERYQKEAYQFVNETDKQKRSLWMNFIQSLQQKYS